MVRTDYADDYEHGTKDCKLAEQSSVQGSSQKSAVSFILIPPTPSSCPHAQPNNTRVSPSSVQVPVVPTATSALDDETNTIEADSSVVNLPDNVDMVPGYDPRNPYSSGLNEESLYTLEKSVRALKYRLRESGRKHTGRGLEEKNDYHERDLRKPTEDEIAGLQVWEEKDQPSKATEQANRALHSVRDNSNQGGSQAGGSKVSLNSNNMV
jgi:hypothetical protein